MGWFVNDLLDLVRMEFGYMGLYYEMVNLYEFLEKIFCKFFGVVKEKGVLFIEDIVVFQLECVFDEDKMEQVFINFIDNVLCYIELGGSVYIVVQIVKDGLKIDIKDFGLGIFEEDLFFIFECFYKVDKVRIRGRVGIGFGFVIVKNIVEVYGGLIVVYSSIDKGMVFIFYILIKVQDGV